MNKNITKKPELMAPAGNWTMLRAAVDNGANAIYFGIDQLNMRAKAKNFKLDNLNEIASFCKQNNVKSYLTLNTIIYENELTKVEELILQAKSSGIDMIICWDFSVIERCRKHNMPFAVSTQASVSNSSSAEMFKQLGAKRIVLARECSLQDVIEIKSKVGIEIEAFVHGAMCIAISGRCFMSYELFGKSANRGECIQPCRREYEVKDSSTDKKMILGEDYVLSPNDLCTIEYLDKLIEAGIDSFKIEGRKRSPEYTAKVVSVYRRAIDLYFEDKLTDEVKREFLDELKSVYNRGFSTGFYFDLPGKDQYAGIYGSKATTKKEYIGKVNNYYKKAFIAEIKIETGKLLKGDKILIVGETTGVEEIRLDDFWLDDKPAIKAEKGAVITLPSKKILRPRDSVYLIKELAEKQN